MKRLNWLDWTAFVLLIVGGINWGLVGFFNFNLVTAIFGTAVLSRVIFALVGLSALYTIYSLTKVGSTTGMMKPERAEERLRKAA